MRMPRGIVAGILLWVWGGAVLWAQSEKSDPKAEYGVRWFEITVAVADLAKASRSLNATAPDEAIVKAFHDATDRLENGASALLRSVPPKDSAQLHAAAMPCVIEIVGAAREVIQAVEARKPAEIAANLDWLQDALQQLRRALKRTVEEAAKAPESD